MYSTNKYIPNYEEYLQISSVRVIKTAIIFYLPEWLNFCSSSKWEQHFFRNSHFYCSKFHRLYHLYIFCISLIHTKIFSTQLSKGKNSILASYYKAISFYIFVHALKCLIFNYTFYGGDLLIFFRIITEP